MTQAEKNTVLDRASNLFQEWIWYLKESGTKFNLPPRQELEETIEDWSESFMKSLDDELTDLTNDSIKM